MHTSLKQSDISCFDRVIVACSGGTGSDVQDVSVIVLQIPAD